MSKWDRQSMDMPTLPKPGRTLWSVMLGLLGLWLMFAMAINWGGADPALFQLLVGNTERILAGEVWRFITAPLLHLPSDPWHVVGVLLGLFFLTPSLEARWGSRRLLGFLGLAAISGYLCQFAVELLLPDDVSRRLSGGYWFGAIPVIEAVAVAWALSFRGQTVRLMFVLPVTTTGLLVFVIGMSVLRLISAQQTPEGLISPFGGMAAGWFFGAGTPSPARRLYLRLRYSQLQRQADRARADRSQRVKHARFSVIEGGRGQKDDDDEPPSGRYLN